MLVNGAIGSSGTPYVAAFVKDVKDSQPIMTYIMLKKHIYCLSGHADPKMIFISKSSNYKIYIIPISNVDAYLPAWFSDIMFDNLKGDICIQYL